MNALTSPLLTDLYQLTMMQAYLTAGMEEEAVFEFYVRHLPERRGFLVACGLEQVLSFLQALHFSAREIAWLEQTKRFSPELLDYLSRCSFTGDVHALPEGTIFFANEPVVRIAAPIPVAQLVETRIINLLNFEISIASKAARSVQAARGRALLVDFGLRRAHGAEAGMLAARASFAAGFTGTSNMLAGALYGLPVFGTMAHAYVEAFDNEEEAFIQFARANPDNVTLLIDTYDTIRGAQHACRAAREVAKEGIRTRAVRLDSGDLLSLSKDVRAILDSNALSFVQIFASGNIDEDEIERLLSAGAPIDGFGIGTKLATSADAPYLECAYKLMEYAGGPKLKISTGKATLPGRKQVFRRLHAGVMSGDTVALEHSECEGMPLLTQVMKNGRLLNPLPSLSDIASHTKRQMASLPESLRGLIPGDLYPVTMDPSLLRLRDEAQARIKV
jgi:nicotinate phosphoribosyltransferase